MRAGLLAPIALTVALAACGKSRREEPPPIVWHTMAEGEALAKKEHKLALIFFGAEWSKADKELEYETFPAREVREELRDWIAIKVDVTDDEDPEVEKLKRRFDMKGCPMTLVGVDFDDPWTPDRSEAVRYNEFVKAPVMAAAIRLAKVTTKSRRPEPR
jgi:thiol:disulfide interchange protein DsbD